MILRPGKFVHLAQTGHPEPQAAVQGKALLLGLQADHRTAQPARLCQGEPGHRAAVPLPAAIGAGGEVVDPSPMPAHRQGGAGHRPPVQIGDIVVERLGRPEWGLGGELEEGTMRIVSGPEPQVQGKPRSWNWRTASLMAGCTQVPGRSVARIPFKYWSGIPALQAVTPSRTANTVPKERQKHASVARMLKIRSSVMAGSLIQIWDGRT